MLLTRYHSRAHFLSKIYKITRFFSLDSFLFFVLLFVVLFALATPRTALAQADQTLKTLKANVKSAKESEGYERQEFNDLRELSRLITTGQLNAAQKLMDQIEQKAAGRPDVEFYKGVLLAEQGKSSQAISVYQRLTESFPDMPEAHNNLGVLFASIGMMDQARDCFLKAVKAFPSYAIAHENLGDVYVRLAKQFYKNALGYSPGSTTLIDKQQDIKSFILKYELELPFSQ